MGSPSAGSNSNDSTTAFGVSGAVRTSGAPAVLYVNVDGTPMHVDPAVLEHVHDSRLYDMLVRQVHVLPRDDLGRPFLSYNPRVFQVGANCLTPSVQLISASASNRLPDGIAKALTQPHGRSSPQCHAVVRNQHFPRASAEGTIALRAS